MTTTDVRLMAKTPGAQAAYEVKCPTCKALPGRFCVVIGPMPGPYTPPNPKLGQPCKRPHNDRFNKVHDAAARQARAEAMEAWDVRTRDPVRPERQALAQLAIKEFTDMRDWLRQNGGVLWT